MGFPKELFGKCPRCGGDAGDYPAADLSSADAQDNIDAVGSGYPLKYFKGEPMCQMCIKEVKADDESVIVAEKHADEEQFRGNAGFVKTIS